MSNSSFPVYMYFPGNCLIDLSPRYRILDSILVLDLKK